MKLNANYSGEDSRFVFLKTCKLLSSIKLFSIIKKIEKIKTKNLTDWLTKFNQSFYHQEMIKQGPGCKIQEISLKWTQ